MSGHGAHALRYAFLKFQATFGLSDGFEMRKPERNQPHNSEEWNEIHFRCQEEGRACPRCGDGAKEAE